MENHGKPFTEMDDLGVPWGTRILGNLYMDRYFFGGWSVESTDQEDAKRKRPRRSPDLCRGFHLSGRFMQSATVQ